MIEVTPEQQSKLESLGHKMFTMFSQNGFPPDMFLDQVLLPKNMKAYILEVYLEEMLNHKRTSGITEERVDKIRSHNREVISRFIETGEAGVYWCHNLGIDKVDSLL